MVKKIAIGLVLLLLIAAGAVQYLWSNIDAYVKTAIETYGSQALKTEVKLNSVKISLTSGEGALNGLSIGNPSGFQQPKAFYMGSITLALDTRSFSGKGPVVIREIIIEKPQLTYEMNNAGLNNLQTIERVTQASAVTPGRENGNVATDRKGNERKFIINDLIIRDGQINVTQDMVPDKAFAAPLPPIHLSNIGKQQGGVTPAQIAGQVLASIVNSAARVAENGLLNKAIGSQLGGAKGDEIRGKLKGIVGR